MSGSWVRRLLGLLVLLGLVMLLGGCAAKPQIVTKVQLVRPDVPVSLLNCAPAPSVPTIVNQASVAQYIVALWQDDLQCHAHLDSVRQVLARKPF